MIVKEQYQEWRHHPVTKVFLQFLRDKQSHFKAVAVESWIDGNAFSDVVRGQIVEMGEIAELPFEAIEAFYKERDNAAEGITATETGLSPGQLLGEE